MGRSSTFYCKTCKVAHYLGYGSYGTWLDDCRTVEEYDEKAVGDLGERAKNRNVRKALEQHTGHDFMTHSSDWTRVHAGKLLYDAGYSEPVLIDDYDQWTHDDFAD